MASGDDPYANIAIDFSKVKAAPIATKPFEAKTEEEKQKEADARTMKSALKTTEKDFAKAKENPRSVRFGKSTTYQVNVDSDDSGFFNKADMDRDGRGSPRPGNKVG